MDFGDGQPCMQIPVPTLAFAVAKATLHVSEHLFFCLYNGTVVPTRAWGPHTECTEILALTTTETGPGGAGPWPGVSSQARKERTVSV